MRAIDTAEKGAGAVGGEVAEMTQVGGGLERKGVGERERTQERFAGPRPGHGSRWDL